MSVTPWATAAVLVFMIAMARRFDTLALAPPGRRWSWPWFMTGCAWSLYWVLIAAVITSPSSTGWILPVGAAICALITETSAPATELTDEPTSKPRDEEENFGWMV